jgi:hypothetical protein
MAIWQDLVDDHGFTARYASVRRFVLTLPENSPVKRPEHVRRFAPYTSSPYHT